LCEEKERTVGGAVLSFFFIGYKQTIKKSRDKVKENRKKRAVKYGTLR